MSKTARGRSHRIYQPGKRHMELMPSVSRSSGLEKDGDALRSHKVQEEYRVFIQGKVDAYWENFSIGRASGNEKQRDEVRGNLLILFRKLREGLLSSKRSDTFAVEVYETSLYLSVVFNSPTQTTTILSHLLPDLYQTLPQIPRTTSSTTLLSALHFLVTEYPSQSRCRELLGSVPPSFFPRDSPPHRWISEVMQSLRSHNFARFENLTNQYNLRTLLLIGEATEPPCPTRPVPSSSQGTQKGPADLSYFAFLTLLDALRQRARETAWLVIRSAYRELHCRAPDGDESQLVKSPTCDWLYRALSLRALTIPVECRDVGSDDEQVDSVVPKWLERRCAQGEVRRKEGNEGRWIVCKPAST